MALVNNFSQQTKNKPLQFKRGTSRAFWRANLVLLEGQPAFETDTNKLKIGDGKTRYNSLPYIGGQAKGEDGKSAYQIWRDAGFSGTVDDFLESLIGPAGKSAYEIWLSIGNEGTIVDFIVSLQGDSAYDIWLKEGNKGTITDFLESLRGKSAYEIWISLGHEGSEDDFINSLKGKSAYDIWISLGNEGTEEDFINSLKGKSAYDIWISLGHEGSEEDFINSLKGEKGDKGESAFEVWKKEYGKPDSTIEDYMSTMITASWSEF